MTVSVARRFTYRTPFALAAALAFCGSLACGGSPPHSSELGCMTAETCVTPGPCEVAAGATCVQDPESGRGECRYQAMVCDDPPPPECVEGGTKLRTYTTPGTCAAGECRYAHSDNDCPSCSTNPSCNSCAGVTCADTQSGCRSGGHCVPGATPTCVYSTLAPATQACDDGNACTYDDHCDGRGLCVATSLACANDAGPCGAVRTCNGTATCNVTYADGSQACDDGDRCTHTDRCNGAGGCAGTRITCTSDSRQCGVERVCNGTATCTVIPARAICEGTCCLPGQSCEPIVIPFGDTFYMCR